MAEELKEKVIHKISGNVPSEKTTENYVTDERLGNELGYVIGREFIEEMLEKGLISQAEFNQIEQKNRDTFLPHLVDLLPKIT